jgi:hypothetical protein
LLCSDKASNDAVDGHFEPVDDAMMNEEGDNSTDQIIISDDDNGEEVEEEMNAAARRRLTSKVWKEMKKVKVDGV